MPVYDPITKSYSEVGKADPRDKIDVEIGDSKDSLKFQPQLKIMRWDNEVNCSFRLVHSETLPSLSASGNKVLWQGTAIEANWYPIPDSEEHEEGGYEFEVVLKQPPPTNVIEFTIESKGVDFCYQPPISDTEGVALGVAEGVADGVALGVLEAPPAV